MFCVKCQTELVLLFLILSSSVLATMVQGSYAIKDVPDQDTTKVDQNLATSFHHDKQVKQQESPNLATFSQYGGTIICQKVNATHTCDGYGQFDMKDTYLYTYLGHMALDSGCGTKYCVTAYWKSVHYPEDVDIGGVPYYWSHGTMYACIPGECSLPASTWYSVGDSPEIKIEYMPDNTPVTIVASYYYELPTGNLLKEIIYQNVMNGYG